MNHFYVLTMKTPHGEYTKTGQTNFLDPESILSIAMLALAEAYKIPQGGSGVIMFFNFWPIP